MEKHDKLDPAEWLTTGQYAKRIGVSRQRVSFWVKERLLPLGFWIDRGGWYRIHIDCPPPMRVPGRNSLQCSFEVLGGILEDPNQPTSLKIRASGALLGLWRVKARIDPEFSGFE